MEALQNDSLDFVLLSWGFWVFRTGVKHLSCKMAPSFSSEWLAHCHGDTKGPLERHPKESQESWHITLEYWIVLGLNNLLEDHWNLKCWVCFLIHNVDTILALSWCRMLAVYFSNSSATAGIPVSLSWNICSTHVEPPEVTYTWKEGATWLQHAVTICHGPGDWISWWHWHAVHAHAVTSMSWWFQMCCKGLQDAMHSLEFSHILAYLLFLSDTTVLLTL